jgi:hypothetical protein
MFVWERYRPSPSGRPVSAPAAPRRRNRRATESEKPIPVRQPWCTIRLLAAGQWQRRERSRSCQPTLLPAHGAWRWRLAPVAGSVAMVAEMLHVDGAEVVPDNRPVVGIDAAAAAAAGTADQRSHSAPRRRSSQDPPRAGGSVRDRRRLNPWRSSTSGTKAARVAVRGTSASLAHRQKGGRKGVGTRADGDRLGPGIAAQVCPVRAEPPH